MTTNRRNSGKIARNFVIERLNQRGYNVLNIQNMNLSVESQNGFRFVVKITSLSKQNAWIIPDSENKGAYYILVLKPIDSSYTAFILKPEEMKKEKERHLRSRIKPINEYKNPELEKKGLRFNQPFAYKNHWNSLPE